MTVTSLQTVYDNLNLLEQGDVAKSALYRELAQEVIADPAISMNWRQAISERLNYANHMLAMRTVGGNDSY